MTRNENERIASLETEVSGMKDDLAEIGAIGSAIGATNSASFVAKVRAIGRWY